MIKELNRTKLSALIGLMYLAKIEMSKLRDIEESVKELLEVEQVDYETSGIGDPEHIGDAIYSEYSVNELLGKLGIAKVK